MMMTLEEFFYALDIIIHTKFFAIAFSSSIVGLLFFLPPVHKFLRLINDYFNDLD